MPPEKKFTASHFMHSFYCKKQLFIIDTDTYLIRLENITVYILKTEGLIRL